MLRRALKNLILYTVGLGIVLFATAGTVRFAAAWIYLVLFAACSLAITLDLAIHDPALLERRLRAGPAAEQELSQRIIQAAASVLLFATMVIAGLDHRFGWSLVPLWVVIAGDLAFVLSFFVIFVVFRANTFTSGVIEVAPEQQVISSGPYAWVRHPLYSGGMLFVLAVPLALASWWALIPGVLMCAAIIVRLLHEERFLKIRLAGYDAYCADVRWRLVPGLW